MESPFSFKTTTNIESSPTYKSVIWIMNKPLNVGSLFPLVSLLLVQYLVRYLDTLCKSSFPKKDYGK